jgi:hypothetical protein
MRGSRKIFLALGGVLCLTIGTASPGGKPRSTSTSRQFLVYGADVRLRGAVCDLAEQTKAGLLRLLDLRDNWKTPLIVNLDYPQANLPDLPAARLEVSQLGYGLKLQLNLLVTSDIRGRSVQEELLRAILVEMMYRERGNIAAGMPYVTPPDWLVAGVLGSQAGRSSDEDAELLQSVLAASRIAPLAEIVRQRRAQLDAPSQKFFDAYARALVQMLLGAPGGRGKLRQYIRDLPVAPNDAQADLRVHFPETLGRSAAKWWALSVARLSATDRFETLSAQKTAAQLDRALRFTIKTPGGTARDYSLGDYATFRRLPGYRAALQLVSRQLLLLSARSNPSYRPIVQEDYELADLLARGKTRRIEERLERVASYRAVVEIQAREIDDYLNWYEGTQAKTISGAFTQMLEAARAADEEQPRRRDPISVYLDSIEMQME